jgi:hypothetical protein
MSEFEDIREHMEVVGADDEHVGIVDHVEGKNIRLTKRDAAAGGQHRLIPLAWVDDVDDKVRLDRNAEEAIEAWNAA